MNLQEIKGFPNYNYDSDTGQIISKLYHKRRVSITHLGQRPVDVVQLIQDGRRRCIGYNRLVYAIQHDIDYDSMPKDLFIMKDDNGQLVVMDKQGMMELCKKRVADERKQKRLQFIDDRLHELEIMRRAYTEGSHIEAVRYIESRKEMLISTAAKKFYTKRKTVELWYNMALERMVERIDSDTSQVTELTVSMMGLMRKARQKLLKESPLFLKSEHASNSNNKNQRK